MKKRQKERIELLFKSNNRENIKLAQRICSELKINYWIYWGYQLNFGGKCLIWKDYSEVFTNFKLVKKAVWWSTTKHKQYTRVSDIRDPNYSISPIWDLEDSSNIKVFSMNVTKIKLRKTWWDKLLNKIYGKLGTKKKNKGSL